MKSIWDFQPQFKDNPTAFLADKNQFELVDKDGMGSDVFKNLSQEQMQECVLSDILAITIFEIQSGYKLDFTFVTLVRYVASQKFAVGHVRSAFSTLLRAGYFTADATKTNGQLRIALHRIANACNDCGVYYTDVTTGKLYGARK